MQQYIRHVRVDADGGKFSTFSDGDTGLRVRFEVHQAVRGTPPYAVIMLSNVSTETKSAFQKEYKKVSSVPVIANTAEIRPFSSAATLFKPEYSARM